MSRRTLLLNRNKKAAPVEPLVLPQEFLVTTLPGQAGKEIRTFSIA